MLQYPAPVVGAGYICTRPWKKNGGSLEIISVVVTSSEVQSLWVSHGNRKSVYLSKPSIGKVADDIMRSGSDRNWMEGINTSKETTR